MKFPQRNESNVTHCWVKGKEVSLSPLQCPAELDGADAKLCCRICYGANCCQPRKPRVNQSKCPQETQRARASLDRVATPAVPTAAPKKKQEMGAFSVAIVSVVMTLVVVGIILWCLPSKWCERLCPSDDEEDLAAEEEWIRSILNFLTRRDPPADRPVHVYPPNPPPRNVGRAAPPPYSRDDPIGSHSPPPPYSISPVVMFRRSGSQSQDDAVVILPQSGGQMEEAPPGSTPEATDLPEVIASGGPLEPPDPSVGQ
uniref:Uncharacterized protein n=1 Tax=Sphaerodactylus townsendi TaxID=933632 RepID=A0ACB8FX07_9SAUR